MKILIKICVIMGLIVTAWLVQGCSFVQNMFYSRPMVVQLIQSPEGNKMLAVQESLFAQQGYTQRMSYNLHSCVGSLKTGTGWAFIINAATTYSSNSLSPDHKPVVQLIAKQYGYVIGTVIHKTPYVLQHGEQSYTVGCATEQQLMATSVYHKPFPAYYITFANHQVDQVVGYQSIDQCNKKHKSSQCYTYDNHPKDFLKFAVQLFEQHQPFMQMGLMTTKKGSIVFIENLSYNKGTIQECVKKLKDNNANTFKLKGVKGQFVCVSQMDFFISPKEQALHQYTSDTGYTLNYINSAPLKILYIKVKDHKIIKLYQYRDYDVCVDSHSKDSCFVSIKKVSELKKYLS